MVDYQKAFQHVVSDKRYLANLDGERPGKVIQKARFVLTSPEIELSLERLRPKLSDEDYWKLKLLIHT